MLTDAAIEAAKPLVDKPFRLYDERGLFILINPNGGKWWRLKYFFKGKEGGQALGVFPEIDLVEARRRRDAAHKLIESGIDPAVHRREAKQGAKAARSNTVQVVGEKWRTKWAIGKAEGTVSKVTGLLNNYVYPVIGDIPIREVSPKMLLERVLEPIEKQGLYETTHQVKRRIGQIMRFGAISGVNEHDATTHLRGALVPSRVTHNAAITAPPMLAPLVRSVWSYQGRPQMQAAIKLLALLFPRGVELRQMEWQEIDFSVAEWRIPESKMKMRVPHIVPLSTQSLEILASIRQTTGCYQFVFPNERGCAFPMSTAALNRAHTRMGYGSKIHTPHGWRATARTILEEVLGYRGELAELQLSHEIKDPNGRAYNRTAFLSQRKEMMQKWADYLDSLRVAAA